ncbi:Mitochondrial translocator assembly and maintenance protein 41 [Clydaea vesicula]|uniref:Phosphatidate cytidylyltransferase, mitochondrial n=1 Tax=Clydaea vesicula TaxID=447962 RepID=A0AAD5Y271_9FUNG|nr:Mitochondrial translocator assembly and maintenance protein 41 [Clydaea vesicula]KAJ3388988.1 Mitochondrial translocator assembly and maintenance protein 41 [Lobulomyces angularis]
MNSLRSFKFYLKLTKRLYSNNSLPSDLSLDYSKVLNHFQAPIRFAAAYGSGVLKQASYDEKNQPMVDFIFGVTHPSHWHSLNLRQNPSHYSSIKHLGAGAVSFLQEKIGAGIYYNPYCNIEGVKIKYGVVSIEDLQADLNEWRSFYLAGRLQKPVKIFRNDARIKLAIRVNLYNSLTVALFSLPAEFSEEDLFLVLAGLSYKGDFRMSFAENPRKVYNIVSKQLDEFRTLYKPIIEQHPLVSYVTSETLHQDQTLKLRTNCLLKLPKSFLNKLKERFGKIYSNNLDRFEGNEMLLLDAISNLSETELKKLIHSSLVDVTWFPTLTQSIKGVITAGPIRTFTYITEKLAKAKK